MKRTIAILGVTLALLAANVRSYANVEDPAIGNQVARGVVFIVPSHDLCFGLELEMPSVTPAAFGGDCE